MCHSLPNLFPGWLQNTQSLSLHKEKNHLKYEKKFPGKTVGPPPTEKTEKIGKIKGTLVRKVPGNLRSQEFVFFVGRFFCPLSLEICH